VSLQGFPSAQFESLNSLFAILEQETPIDLLLNETVRLVVDAVPEAELGAITLAQGDTITTAAQTDPMAAEIDRVEIETGEGPCVEALRTGTMHRVDSYEREDRWPAFSEKVLALGIGSSLGVPLRVEQEVKGALNLYSKSEEAFLHTNLQVVNLFAMRASIGLAHAELHQTNRRLIQDLEEGLKSRELIGKAQGILMEREGCSAEQAFQMLARASQNLNLKLRDIAKRVVEDSDRRTTE